MTWLSNRVLDHLCKVADWPDLTSTRYEALEQIGRGGMATVYRALDKELGREVALKVLPVSSETPPAGERLLNEARVIARLEHPGIVPVHDAGVLPGGRVYYAMKLVRGQRLDQAVAGDVPQAQRLRIFESVCQTIAFAHANGVLHRDLKPQNIMVGAFGEVLVMDWGLARPLHGQGAPDCELEPTITLPHSSTNATQAGTVLGTPGYMAPEQARGALDKIDERTDVYALGGILCFLLTGRAPPVAEEGRALDNSKLIGLRALPRPLRAICLKALSFEPPARYQSATKLSEDIGRFLAQTRVTAYPEGPLDVAVRLAVKYRAAILLILAYVAMRMILLFFAGS